MRVGVPPTPDHITCTDTRVGVNKLCYQPQEPPSTQLRGLYTVHTALELTSFGAHIDMGDIEQLVGSTLAQCQDILSSNNIVYNGQLLYLSIAYSGYVDMIVVMLMFQDTG